MKKQKITITTNANIALIKYWGKRDEALMLPAKSSLSVGLAGLTTTATFELAQRDCVITPEHVGKNFAAKVLQFVEHVRKRYDISQPVSITTHNHFPTAAGLASSASGFAALALGLNELFKLNLSKQELSQLARVGSGSAARSVFGGFVVWHKGLRADSADCFAEQLFPADHWPSLRVVVVVVDASVKKMSSREGMRLTVQTSPSFGAWCAESETRIAQMQQAIAARDLEGVGQLAEADWYGMYRAMLDTEPSLNYLSNASWNVIETVRQLRAAGISCYFTTDAGPNVKILCEEKDANAVERAVAALAGVKQIMRCCVASEPALRDTTLRVVPQGEREKKSEAPTLNSKFIAKENILSYSVCPEPVEGAKRTDNPKNKSSLSPSVLPEEPAGRLEGQITIKVPGKLMLAGEWSVLEPGNSCIVLPINRFAQISIEPALTSTFTAPTLEIFNVPIDNQNPKLAIAQAAISTTTKFLRENGVAIKPFALTINTDQFFFKGQKVGFGSSAAVCVGITRALLEFHELTLDNLSIFKLATLAHYHAQKKIGSGFDIAASTFAQPLLYQRFDAAWLAAQETKNVTHIVQQPWPGLAIQPITLPRELRLCVGFTGTSASTTQLAQHIANYKNKHAAQYQVWCTTTNNTVLELAHALKKNDQEKIISLLNDQQKLLHILSELSGAQLETPMLTALITSAQVHIAGAKFSGAGGGDCGIAVCFEKKIEERIKSSWSTLGIENLENAFCGIEKGAGF